MQKVMPVSRGRKKIHHQNNLADKRLKAITDALARSDERGLLPVRVLCANLTDLFFNISPDFKTEFENEVYNGLHDKIVYKIETNPLSDVAELNTQQQIVLYENFNQYLWNICYSLLVLFDKGIHEPRLKGIHTGTFANTPMVAEAWKVFQAGLSLRKTYQRPVFFELPNSELNQNREYILKTNSIYLAALNFILLHEFAHQYYGHYSYFEPGDQSKKDEHLADEFAIDKMSAHFEEVNGKTLKAGILVGALSLFFLRRKLGGGDSHPDLDIRLKVIIESLHLNELDNLWGIASLALNLWNNDFEHDVRIPPVGETYQELFYETLKDLSRFK
jgi:Peptidase U49